MNILCINYEYPPIGGGAANALGHIARSLAGRGHAVHVLTSAFRDLPRVGVEEGVHVFRVPAARRFREKSNPLQMAAFEAAALAVSGFLAASRGIDRCLLFFTIPGWASALRLHARGIPYVVSLRGGDVPGFDPGLRLFHTILAPVRRAALRRARAVVANSRGLADLSERTDPVPVTVIPNGVDAALYGSGPGREPGACPARLLFVGRLATQKNLDFLLTELAALRREAGPPFELHLAGGGPRERRLRELAHALGLNRHVVWHGHLDRRRIIELYGESDILVFPSHAEGMPNVVLEAMAGGLPVLASDVMGTNELVVHGETGYLFAPGDSGTFRARLRDLLASPERARRMGLAGRERVVRDYTWEAVARAYESLLAGP
ncbi:MAG: glycosyltransferase family 4 protein [Desulfovibrio sp.]|nr:glycosyltransferase family 4 protein [Desulfovibrio sp.]